MAASAWIRSRFTWANTAEAAAGRLVVLTAENKNQPRINAGQRGSENREIPNPSRRQNGFKARQRSVPCFLIRVHPR